MAQRIARPVHLVVAWLLVIGLLVQVFLAGLGVFDDPRTFLTHRDTGYLLTAGPVVLLVAALLGRLGWRHVVAAAAMFVQFILQSVLVIARDDMPAIAALHPVNGFLILLVAVWVANDAWRRWGSHAPEPPSPAERIAS